MKPEPATPKYLSLSSALSNININILHNFTHEIFCTINICPISITNISQQILDVIYDKIKDTSNLTYMLLLKNNVSEILQNNKYEKVHPKINWTDIYSHLDLDNDFIPYYYLQDNDILIFCFLLIEYYNNQIIDNTPINIYINILPYDNPRKLLKFKNYIKSYYSSKVYRYIDDGQIITDGNILIAIIKNNYIALKNASYTLKNDKRIVSIAIKNNYKALEYVSKNIKKCEKFMLKVIKQNYKAYDYVDESLLNNRSILNEVLKQNYKYIPFEKIQELNYEDLIMLVISKDGNYLKYLSINLRDNEFMVMAAIRNCPCAIQYAGINCKSKIEISLNVVTQDGMCLEYLSDEMKSNDTIVFAAIKECPFAIKYAHDKFKSNKTIALQLVSRNGLCIEYFSNIIKLNNNIIVKALTSNGNAIEFIDVKFHTKKNILIAAEKHINIIEYLKNTNNNLYEDEDITNRALDYNIYVFKDISEKYRNNINNVKKVYKQYPECLLYTSEDIRKNETCILDLILYNRNFYILKYIHTELLENIDFMMKLFEKYPYTVIYEYIPDKLKINKTFLEYLLQQNGEILNYINNDLLDPTLIMTAIKQNNNILLKSWFTLDMLYIIIRTEKTALYYIGPFIYSQKSPTIISKLDAKCIIIDAVRYFGCSLEYVSDQDKQDITLVLVAVKNNGMALQFAHSVCRSNYDIVLAAVINNGMALQFAHIDCGTNYDIALAAVKNNGMALQYACDKHKLLNRIVLPAVMQNGMALQYAKLTNYELIATAVRQDGLALQFVPNTIKNYKDVVAIAIAQNENAKKYIKMPTSVNTEKAPVNTKKAMKKLDIKIEFNY